MELYPIKDDMYSVNQNPSEEIKAIIPIETQKKVVKDNQNIYIIADQDQTWITYKKDNNSIRQFLLKKGEDTFVSGKEVRIFVGNVNAVKVFLNNHPLQLSPTSKNGVKSLVFPREAKSKYKIPLFIHEPGKEVIGSDEYELLINKND